METAQVATARGGNVRFHDEFTADGTYVKQLLENALQDGDRQLPETVLVARTSSSAPSSVIQTRGRRAPIRWLSGFAGAWSRDADGQRLHRRVQLCRATLQYANPRHRCRAQVVVIVAGSGGSVPFCI
ncbi:hypothetical protein PI124_g11100 [Phytophthora idaei]|nr:hypothetical protein PI125_g10487 [Phytophthora idaei]KAG3140986.1 hypothetical protein PI126_g15708 [Phytophthora idaei]KAG3244104.1 hypothetical protein PI124_g11100 [Phytophthora idaei]